MVSSSILLSWIMVDLVSSQLIGSRGVISLRPGEVYRDSQTVEASEVAARLALIIAREESVFSRRLPHAFSLLQLEAKPVFVTHHNGVAVGRPLQDKEIFDNFDSRFVRPNPEQQFNQPLEEIEVERATSPTRSFPGQGLPPGIHPGPTRPPNRLANLARPTEPSQRTKNALLGTVFDPPVPLTPFVDLGQGGPQLLSPLPSPHHRPFLSQTFFSD